MITEYTYRDVFHSIACNHIKIFYILYYLLYLFLSLSAGYAMALGIFFIVLHSIPEDGQYT
jgi:hypothetical protein